MTPPAGETVVGEDRRPGEGRYARVEREQRWLVGRVPDGARRAASIVDRYLAGTGLRLRRMETDEGVVLKLGQKVRLDPSDPELVKMTNIYLPAADHSVLATLAAAELRKTRWHVPVGGRTVAVDQFHGRLDGLVLAEVELDVDDDRMPLPPFALRDVTDDDRFSGGALAFADEPAIHALVSEVRSMTTTSTLPPGRPPPTVPDASLSLVVLRSPDPGRCRPFYEALGLAFTEERHGSGPAHLAAVLPDGTVVEIYPTTEPGPVARGSLADVRLGLVVEDVDRTLAALDAQGGTVVTAPPSGAGPRRAVVADPDGRRIELTDGSGSTSAGRAGPAARR